MDISQENSRRKIAVCALIIKDSGTNLGVLSVSRKNNINNKGLVGGKVDRKEFLTQALIREVKEETGLDVVKHTLIWERMEHNLKVYTFLTKCKGTISTTETGLVEWLMGEDINKLFDGSFGLYNKNLFQFILNNSDSYYYDDYISFVD